MPQLILSPRDTDDCVALGREADGRGWTVSRLASWRLPPGLALDDGIAIYGEPLFARVVAAQCQRVLLEPPLDWLARVPSDFTHRRVRSMQIQDLDTIEYPAFIKPPDDKILPARVYEDPGFLRQRSDLRPEDAILVSQPVTFAREFRVHLLRGVHVAVSRYSVGGDLSVAADDEACADAGAFAEEAAAAAAAFTPEAVVIDVGLLSDARWSVVEANPVFGAGIYAGDPGGILDTLLACAIRIADKTREIEVFCRPLELE